MYVVRLDRSTHSGLGVQRRSPVLIIVACSSLAQESGTATHGHGGGTTGTGPAVRPTHERERDRPREAPHRQTRECRRIAAELVVHHASNVRGEEADDRIHSAGNPGRGGKGLL